MIAMMYYVDHSVLCLCDVVLLNAGPLFKAHFPLLLQNAVVLFPDTDEGQDMLTFVALSLGIYNT